MKNKSNIIPQFDVFLSHSSVDKPWVIRLKDDLLRYGVSVWLDRDEIRPGDLFAKALEQALDNCRAVALIVSSTAVTSGWVEEEYYRALSLAETKQTSVQIIPVILREAELSGFLQSRNWVDFRDEAAYAHNVWKLVWGITNKKPAHILDLTAPDSSSIKPIEAVTPVDEAKTIALYSRLNGLRQVSSLSEIPNVLAALKQDLTPLLKPLSQEDADELKVLLSQLEAAVTSLYQYNENTPRSIRAVLLSETIANLEEETRLIRNKETLLYTNTLVNIIEIWQDLLHYESRRLEGQANLTFSTLEEIVAGETITLVFNLHNRGPAPAHNLQVKLFSENLINVAPPAHKIPSLAVDETQILTFTGHNQVDTFTAIFDIVYDDLLAKNHTRHYTALVTTRAKTQAWERIKNPYLLGKPDADKELIQQLFVGREDILHFIKENIVHSAAERIVVLYGHRRTGKTWTLLRLQRCLPTTYLPIYIDVQEFTGLKGVAPLLQIFADEVLLTLKEQTDLDKAAISAIRVPTYAEYEQNYALYFKRVFLSDVQAVLGERKLLWLFDEFQGFDDMVSIGNLPAAFMEFLRNLMQFGKKMAFIFAGTREMTGHYWSVFFNIAVQRKIGTLNDAEAEKLIVDPVKSFKVQYDRFAVPLIKQLTGNHPYFIQLLCDKIVSELNKAEQMLVNAQIIEAATDELVIDGASNLKFYWVEIMNDKEKAIAGIMQDLLQRKQAANVTTICSEIGKFNRYSVPKEVSAILKGLVEKDLLEKDKTLSDTYKFKIGLVERYIEGHIPYAETQGRVGELWQNP